MKSFKGKALLAVLAAVALALTACSSSKSGKSGGSKANANNAVTAGTHGTGAYANCAKEPTTCNSGQTKPGGTLTYVLEKTIPGWNQNFATSGVFEVAEAEDGILPGVFLSGSDLKPYLNTDLMISAEQTKASPQTLVYKVKPDAAWDDGTPIDFADFKYAKDTSDTTTCPKCGPASSAGYTAISSMTPSDNGKTITIVMKTPFADWQTMFNPMLPAHIAAKHGGTTGGDALNASFQWFDKNVPNYSGGPLKITDYAKNTSITEVPNPKWYGKTKSSLDKLVFRIITDQTQEPTALQNNEVQALYAQPDADLVANVDKIPDVQTYLGKGLVWEHLDLNEKNEFLKDKALRTALFEAISRKSIIARTVGQYVPGATALNSHMYVPGQPGYQDNVSSTGQGAGDLAKAKKTLTDAKYTGVGSTLKTPDGRTVTFRCTYSAGNQNRQQTCEIVQNTLKRLGINITLKTTTDLSELNTGNFDMIVFAWVATPFVVAGAQQIFELKGGGDYGHNDDPPVESLINKAAVSTDPATVQSLLNQADKLLTADAYELPLFQKPTFIATDKNLVNIRDNATSFGPPENVQDWGVKAT